MHFKNHLILRVRLRYPLWLINQNKGIKVKKVHLSKIERPSLVRTYASFTLIIKEVLTKFY